ncbi:MAG: cobalamin biosynthesis protein CobQ [Oscillospiraceae bacterium]
MFKRVNIICGHYGSGKTNLSLNIAKQLKSTGKKVTIVDMDIVNPYFRSSDYKLMLERLGIRVISPVEAGSTLDSPSLSAEIFSAFEQDDGYVIVDVGGDDVGANALGRFESYIKALDDYQCIYVINKFRKFVSTPNDAIELMHEIESACRLKMDAIINNSHLSYLTTSDDILSSIDYADEVCNLTQLQLLATTVPENLSDELDGKVSNIYPVEIIVKLPWAEKGDV